MGLAAWDGPVVQGGLVGHGWSLECVLGVLGGHRKRAGGLGEQDESKGASGHVLVGGFLTSCSHLLPPSLFPPQ